MRNRDQRWAQRLKNKLYGRHVHVSLMDPLATAVKRAAPRKDGGGASYAFSQSPLFRCFSPIHKANFEGPLRVEDGRTLSDPRSSQKGG
jgi:hypothetical protein